MDMTALDQYHGGIHLINRTMDRAVMMYDCVSPEQNGLVTQPMTSEQCCAVLAQFTEIYRAEC